MLKSFLSATLLAFFFTLTPSVVFADDDVTITLNPENPTPKSAVTLSLRSYVFNTGTVMVTWEVNGKVVLKGRGEDTLTIRTGGVGSVQEVTTTVERPDGGSIKQSISISPSSVTLLYESPRSYVPLLYEGRSLPGDGATVRVTAFPQMSDGRGMLDPQDLSYSWYIDDDIVKQASGHGKQSANIKLNYLQDESEIKVVVYSPRGNVAQQIITVAPHPIMPLLYTYDPIFGSNFTTLVDRRYEATKDFTLSLEPLYLSYMEETEPTYSWFLDGLPSTPLGGRLLSLHPKEDSYGSKRLTITVEGPNKILQEGETTLDLIFDTRK